MKVLIDTNVLLRGVQARHPAYRIARRTLLSLYREKHTLCLTTQNVAEFWNVCTRPVGVNGLGLTIEETEWRVSRLESIFTILPDSLEVFRIWRRLVVEYAVIGMKVHDTRLVASMKVHGISQIVTFNDADFKRFTGIDVRVPD